MSDRKARRGRDWSLNPAGNRVLYSVLVALVVNVATGTWYGWIVGAVLLLITSAIVTAGRNRQAGSDRQP
jgi:asparagine N-glycosylation enzyme membrane subunit Stt3